MSRRFQGFADQVMMVDFPICSIIVKPPSGEYMLVPPSWTMSRRMGLLAALVNR